MTLIYRLIVIFILLIVLRCQFREKDIWVQAIAALTSIPLILRALMIK